MGELHITVAAMLGSILLLATIAMWFAWHKWHSRYASVSLQLGVNYHDILLPSPNQTEQFCTFFDSAPESVSLQLMDGTIEQINLAGVSLFKANYASQVIQHSVYNFIALEYHDAYHEMSQAVFRGKPGFIEFELVSLKGTLHWLQSYMIPLRDEENNIVHILAITRDISKQKVMLQQLELQRNQLQTIIESEPECIKLQDRHGAILEINPAGLSLLDAQYSEQVIGKTVYEFLIPEYREEYHRLTETVFKGGRGSMEFEVFSLNGKRRWLETHAAPLMNNEGQVSALLAITRDIDERKKTEEQLRQQQVELARVCRLSTMGEMASTLAHELNQPLCAISSYAESAQLLNIDANVELEKLLKKIVCQSQRATQIIQHIRDFVRKQSPQPVFTSVEEILSTVTEFIEPERRKERIDVRLQIPGELRPIKVDRIQIEQVLLNLFSNAIQAMQVIPHQDRKIKVSVSNESSHKLLFRFFNAGNPIDKAIASQLFIPFYTTKSTGMGMGLAISRSIIEVHGGQIWYQEPVGGGACFYFTLPYTDNE